MPIDTTTIKTLYVFVEIAIDSRHLAETVRLNFPNERDVFHTELLSSEEKRSRIAPGEKIGVTRHLRIEGPTSEDKSPATSEESSADKQTQLTRLALVSTIQFVAALQRLKEDLSIDFSSSPSYSGSSIGESSSQPRLWTGAYNITIPRSKPLSPGEILGCTAPTLQDVDALM